MRHFRWAFLATLACQFAVSGFLLDQPQTLGASGEWTAAGYKFTAGTAPWAMGFSVLICVLYLLLRESDQLNAGAPLPGLFRRFAAFWIDFILAMSAVTTPPVRSKASPEACVVGYQVLPDSAEPLTWRRALFRTLVGFVAVCGACFAPFAGRSRREGKFWLDKMFHTRAVHLK